METKLPFVQTIWHRKIELRHRRFRFEAPPARNDAEIGCRNRRPRSVPDGEEINGHKFVRSIEFHGRDLELTLRRGENHGFHDDYAPGPRVSLSTTDFNSR
ncbi:hypothetical protein K1719_019344 [Acacia pycnantha]|nr:hypothetical protein K1719_019344 [Acacia pycnantha]